MKTLSPGVLAAGLIGLTGIILVSIGAPSSRRASQTVSGPVVSPACGTLRNPAARAAAQALLTAGAPA